MNSVLKAVITSKIILSFTNYFWQVFAMKTSLKQCQNSQRFPVRVRLLAMWRGELSPVITQLMSNCLWSGWKWKWGVKGMPSRFPCSPVICECSWKETQIKKKRSLRLKWLSRCCKDFIIFSLFSPFIHCHYWFSFHICFFTKLQKKLTS